MIKARQYHTKLVNLKKEMANLVERSTRLKVGVILAHSELWDQSMSVLVHRASSTILVNK